jgi:hypothetical protein
MLILILISTIIREKKSVRVYLGLRFQKVQFENAICKTAIKSLIEMQFSL